MLQKLGRESQPSRLFQEIEKMWQKVAERAKEVPAESIQ